MATDWPALRRRVRRWRRYWLRDPLLGALGFLLLSLCRVLPLDWCSALGGALGRLNGRYRYHAVRERACRGYLRLAAGNPTRADAERAVRRLFDNTGRVMTELALLDRLWAAGRIDVEGAEHLVDARRGDRPLIVMGVHLGNWEIIGATLIGLLPGVETMVIYMPPANRFEHRMAVAARRRYGIAPLSPDVVGARMAYRLLVERRGVLLVYADDERQGHVSAPLFGRQLRPRANLRNIIRWAWASGAAVVPAYAERLAGARFRVTCLAPVALARSGADPAAALRENVERLDRVIAPLVLAHLDNWYMLFDFARD